MRRVVLALAAVLAVPAAPVQTATGQDETAVPAVQVRAAAWYVVGQDGSLLSQRNAHQRRAIASITKLMTAIVTLERARLSDVVTVSSQSSAVGGSTAFLRTGDRAPVSSLLRTMLVVSANDAAEALALHVGRGSVDRFVEHMNAKARELGLDETTFANPHGLDESGHLSTAEDTTLLVRYALGIPFIRDALNRTSVSVPSGRSIPTTDDLLSSWPPLIGGKTGHTAAAGWSEAAAARGRGLTVYGTVLGSETRAGRNEALQAILTYGIERYRRIVAVDAGRVYAEAATGYDRAPVELVAPRTLLRTVREGRSLVEHIIAPGVVTLPVRQGQPLGRVKVYEGGRLLASSKLVAARSVSEPGVLGKAAWYAKRTAENLWELVT